MAFRRGIQLRLALLHYRFAGAHFTLSLIEQGSGGQDRAFRFLDLRGGFKTLLVQYPGIHSRQHLSLVHELTLFDQNGVDTPGDFTGNIDFVASIRPRCCWQNRPGVSAGAASTMRRRRAPL